MSLYKKWEEQFENATPETKDYYKEYLNKERDTYRMILEKNEGIVEGTVSELAERFSLTDLEMVGFIDGINESILKPVNLDELQGDSNVKLEINFKQLYRNMLKAHAPWLYNLDAWQNVFSEEELAEYRKEYRLENMAKRDKVGRNEICPCGSGKKYKKCCG